MQLRSRQRPFANGCILDQAAEKARRGLTRQSLPIAQSSLVLFFGVVFWCCCLRKFNEVPGNVPCLSFLSFPPPAPRRYYLYVIKVQLANPPVHPPPPSLARGHNCHGKFPTRPRLPNPEPPARGKCRGVGGFWHVSVSSPAKYRPRPSWGFC